MNNYGNGGPFMSALSPKQIAVGRIGIGGFFMFLAVFDLLMGTSPTSEGRWAWLYMTAQQIFGEHARVILESLIGGLLVFWGWATYPSESAK